MRVCLFLWKQIPHSLDYFFAAAFGAATLIVTAINLSPPFWYSRATDIPAFKSAKVRSCLVLVIFVLSLTTRFFSTFLLATTTVFAMASTLLISPLNFSYLAGDAGFVSVAVAGAGAVSVLGGAAAMAPKTKTPNVRRAINRIVFFI